MTHKKFFTTITVSIFMFVFLMIMGLIFRPCLISAKGTQNIPQETEHYSINYKEKEVYILEECDTIDVFNNFTEKDFKDYKFILVSDWTPDWFIYADYKTECIIEGNYSYLPWSINHKDKTITIQYKDEHRTLNYYNDGIFDEFLLQKKYKGYTLIIENGIYGYPDNLYENEKHFKKIIYPLSQSYYDEFTYTINENKKTVYIDRKGVGVVGFISNDVFPAGKFKDYTFIISENIIGVPFTHQYCDTKLEFKKDGKLSNDISYHIDEKSKTITLSGKGTLPYYDYQSVFPTDYFKGYSIKISPDIAGSNYYLTNYYNAVTYDEGYLASDFTYEVDKAKKIITVKGTGKISSLNTYAFRHLNGNDYTLVISDGITGFETNFDVCSTIKIGKDVKDLPTAKGEYYEVDSKNPYYASYKGALYTKDYKKLLCYPKSKETSEFHPNTEVITKGAFNKYNKNVTIVIPWGVTQIEDEAFGYADSNFSYVIPDTVRTVGKPSLERQVSPGRWIYPTWIPSRNNQVVWDEWVIKQPPKGPGDKKQPNSAPYDNIASYYGIRPDSLKTFQNNKTYYFDNNYKMVKGWKKVNGTWYYFNDYGAAVVKIWLKSGNKWYYMQSDGTMAVNKWINWYNKWYYVGADGAMYANRRTPDGYWVNASGVWVK